MIKLTNGLTTEDEHTNKWVTFDMMFHREMQFDPFFSASFSGLY